MGEESRQLGASLQGPGNLWECRNAWWGWKDSNLQTRDYKFTSQRSLLRDFPRSIKSPRRRFFSTGLPAREERACEIEGTIKTFDVHACEPGFARA
jgi:hypothetical protein